MVILARAYNIRIRTLDELPSNYRQININPDRLYFLHRKGILTITHSTIIGDPLFGTTGVDVYVSQANYNRALEIMKIEGLYHYPPL